jgi:hypothetical protein
MEPNQVHPVATAVSGDAQQIIHALEARFTSQIVRNVLDSDWRNGVHDNVPLVHPITTACFHTRAHPDTNAASDSAAPDSLAEAFGEQHPL